MSLSAIVKALIDAGATPQMILAAVEADERCQTEKEALRREATRQRVRRYRDNKKLIENNDVVTDVTVTNVSSVTNPSDGFPNPSLTPPHSPKEKPPKGVKKKNPFLLPDWIPVEPWEALLETRAKKKAPSTDYAMWRIVGKLEEYRAKGHDPTKLLNEAVEKGWQTVFEPKEQHEKHSGNTRKPQRHSGFKEQDYTAGTGGFIVG